MKVGFDMDGVLLDSESDPSWLDRALDAALEEVGLPATEEDRRALYPGRIHDFESTAAALGVDADELWAARTRNYTREKVAAVETGEIPVFDDVEALARLEGRPFLISNSPQEVVDAVLATGKLPVEFDPAVGRGQDRAALEEIKPATSFYERVREERGAGTYVYVGDDGNDREFAARTGMGYVHLDRDDRGLDDVVADVLAGQWSVPE